VDECTTPGPVAWSVEVPASVTVILMLSRSLPGFVIRVDREAVEITLHAEAVEALDKRPIGERRRAGEGLHVMRPGSGCRVICRRTRRPTLVRRLALGRHPRLRSAVEGLPGDLRHARGTANPSATLPAERYFAGSPLIRAHRFPSAHPQARGRGGLPQLSHPPCDGCDPRPREFLTAAPPGSSRLPWPSP